VTSPFLDDEWLRRIFPLLNRPELKVCQAIADIEGRPTEARLIGDCLELSPHRVKQALAQLERAGVIWRSGLAKGRFRLGFLPDLPRAEQLLLAAGRRPAAPRRAA